MRSWSVPSRVSRVRSRKPLRYVWRSAVLSCRAAPITPSTSASISNCTTASATERRKSPSPAFCSNSTSGSLSSVIGPPHRSEWELRNSTLDRWSDGHLALHPHGHRISTTSADATAVSRNTALNQLTNLLLEELDERFDCNIRPHARPPTVCLISGQSS